MTFDEWFEEWSKDLTAEEALYGEQAAWDACEKNMRDHVAEAMEKWGQHTGAAERALGPDEKPENSI
tara:strand:+ start:61 stop:261 length:201 start_codon:yes stop_codon:yes gene_type:complete